jgi:hypothetical protein
VKQFARGEEARSSDRASFFVLPFAIMVKQFKVEDVKCIDDSSQTRGVTILCGPRTMVSLIFDDSIAHKQTDEVMHLLWSKLRIKEVVVQIPGD